MYKVLLPYSVLYIGALAALFWVTRNRKKYYTQAKTVCSSMFVAVCLIMFVLKNKRVTDSFLLLMTALIFCMAGDILLGLANKSEKLRVKPFLAGAVTFALAHVLLCTLYYKWAVFGWADVVIPLLLVVVLYVLEKTGLVCLKKLRPVGYGYTLIVAAMVTKAVRVAVGGNLTAFAALCTGAGSLLFFISDVVLLFLYFGTRRRKWYRYVNLGTYYAGVYLIALSAYGMA